MRKTLHMAKKEQVTSEAIVKQIKKRDFAPIYYLMGEESYYIDLLAKHFEEEILTEQEKEFNLTIVYGSDVDIPTIIDAAKRYPMLSEYQVVIVREAQNIRSNSLDSLAYYLEKPQKSTVLVFCHKNGSLNRSRKIAKLIEEKGVLFESKKIRDYQLPQFINTYIVGKQFTITPKATEMVSDAVGGDLSRVVKELEKLMLSLPKGQRRITENEVEQIIGISKEFNNFEFRKAIINRDVLKANLIGKYFSENPKENPIQVTLAVLFSFFANLMLAYYAPVKTKEGIAEMLDLRSPWQAEEYLQAMRMYTGVEVMEIIGYLRETDAASKGIVNSMADNASLLKQLIYRILH